VVASLQSWLRRKSLWPPRLRQQVTRTGLAYTATLLLVALVAFVSANNLMFLILAAMLSTFMISGFISKMGLAGLELELFLPQHISARRKVRAGVRLKNTKTWIPSFSIHLEGAAESGFDTILYFPVLPGGATVEEAMAHLKEAVELFLECADPGEVQRRLHTEVFVTRFEATHG